MDFAELVFGFVYAVGTDADPVIDVFKRYLNQYGYSTSEEDEFRISKQLRSLKLGIPSMTPRRSADERPDGCGK